jgi:ABC-type branched-subunit amino acid transport system ATPase component
MEEKILQVMNVEKHFGGLAAVKGLDFSVSQMEIA